MSFHRVFCAEIARAGKIRVVFGITCVSRGSRKDEFRRGGSGAYLSTQVETKDVADAQSRANKSSGGTTDPKAGSSEHDHATEEVTDRAARATNILGAARDLGILVIPELISFHCRISP